MNNSHWNIYNIFMCIYNPIMLRLLKVEDIKSSIVDIYRVFGAYNQLGYLIQKIFADILHIRWISVRTSVIFCQFLYYYDQHTYSYCTQIEFAEYNFFSIFTYFTHKIFTKWRQWKKLCNISFWRVKIVVSLKCKGEEINTSEYKMCNMKYITCVKNTCYILIIPM